MSFTVSFEKEGCVFVSITSPCTIQDHYSALERALELCSQHANSRILVDLRSMTESFSTVGCFNFGQKLAEQPKYLRIAHVLPHKLQVKEDVKFTSTVEANRGKSTAEFETLEEAKEWLLSR